MKIKNKLKAGFLSFIWAGLLCGAMLVFSPAAYAQEGKTAYYCRGGDSIGQIAAANGIDSQLLAAMNNLSVSARLPTGKLIWLPQEPAQSITVAKGDTLWGLAKKYNTSVDRILALNPLENPNKLKIGQSLLMPVSNWEEPEDALPQAVIAFAQAQPASRGSSFTTPLEGVITSKYGQRKSGFHHGLDIAAPKGSPIYAAKSGLITFAGWRSSIYGYAVDIDHGGNQKTVYAHASQVLVKKGQKVNQGQIIAKVGATGNATGPHVHFEIHLEGKPVDPQKYLR